MSKTGYAICTNCGCNKAEVEVYRCGSCKKMYCQHCAQENGNCENETCDTSVLHHKGFIQPYDEVQEAV